MKLPIRCDMRLYPAAWRARYGAELEALAEDMQCGWREFFDICKGAIQMQVWKGGALRFAVFCGVAGMIVAGIVGFGMHNRYRSMAVLRIPQGDFEEQSGSLQRAEQNILSRSSLWAVVQKYNLYPEERTRLPLEDIIQEMRNRYIQIRRLATSQTKAPGSAFSIAFDYVDPAKAQVVTQDLTERFMAALQDSAPLELLDPASQPQAAYIPNWPAILMAGLVMGMVAGMAVLGIRRWPLVPLAGLALAILVLPATYLIPDVYRSQAVLRGKTVDPGRVAREVAGDPAYLQSVIQKLGLYPQERDGIARMRRSIGVRDIETGKAKVCIVVFDYSNRYKAESVVREIVDRIGTVSPNVKVLDPPSLPEQPFRPNRLAMVLAALFAGLLAGAVALAFRRHLVGQAGCPPGLPANG
jgi:capsular polysaccharide biosynthesis protein